MYEEENIRFMTRAIELAAQGLGKVSPNPPVGCVVVHQGKIIGEGWHKKYGGPHAEVNAIDSVSNKSLLPESDIYVTLEPCAHFGKTPPCSDLLIKHKVRSVSIATKDPNPKVAGLGIKKMENAGIKIELGLLENEAREINKRFLCAFEKKRPYIILKWAETADGFIARSNYDSKWISNSLSRKLVHKWRAEEDAILVGTNTALHDNPKLNVRHWSGKDPVRVVIDKNLKLPKDLSLFDGSVQTLCYNAQKNTSSDGLELIQIPEIGFLGELLNDLHHRGVQSLLVEGGATLLNSFIRENFWDEARVFKSQSRFEDGIAAPNLNGYLHGSETILDDTLDIYYPN